MERLLTDSDLNELLSQAKAAQSKWTEWEAGGEYDRSDEWRALHQAKEDGWKALYRAMRSANEQGPLMLKVKSGTLQVGTVGGLNSSELMRYAQKVGAEITLSGVCLRNVLSIEIARPEAGVANI